MTHHELRDRWESRRDEYRRFGVHVDGAKVVEAFLEDLETVESEQGDEILTLAQAALESEYGKDHLSWLIRSGRIPNAGQRGAPRIRRRDLPVKKNSPVARRHWKGYDLEADARSLRIPRR